MWQGKSQMLGALELELVGMQQGWYVAMMQSAAGGDDVVRADAAT